MTARLIVAAIILVVTCSTILCQDQDVPNSRGRRLRFLQDNGPAGPDGRLGVRRRVVRPLRPLRRGGFGLRRQRPRPRRPPPTTTTTTTTTTEAPDLVDYYDDYYNDYYYDEPYSTSSTTTTTTTTTPKPKPRGRRPFPRRRPGANRVPYDPSRYRNRRRRPRPAGPIVTLGPPIQPPTEHPPSTKPTTTTTTTTTTEGPTSPPRKDGRKINWLHDPNRPRELGDFDLTDYPFYIKVPENITFKCEDHMDGFFASIPHKCQLFHYCFGGYKYDFLCPNYTLYDQTTFTCRFVNMVKCEESEDHYNRNVGLFVPTTTEKPDSSSSEEDDDKKSKRRKHKNKSKKHNKRRYETEEDSYEDEETIEDDYSDDDYNSEDYEDEKK